VRKGKRKEGRKRKRERDNEVQETYATLYLENVFITVILILVCESSLFYYLNWT
jgi:hypothetical protein